MLGRATCSAGWGLCAPGLHSDLIDDDHAGALCDEPPCKGVILSRRGGVEQLESVIQPRPFLLVDPFSAIC